MSKYVTCWKLQTNEKYKELMDKYINKSKELNFINKTFFYKNNSNNRKEDFLENFISESIKFHMNKLNIKRDPRFCVIFSIINSKTQNNIQLDYSSKYDISQEPILSILTHVNDNKNKVNIFTEMDIDDYKYKRFITQKNIYFNSIRSFTQISFNGAKYYCNNSLNDEIVSNTERDIDIDNYSILINVYEKSTFFGYIYYSPIFDIDNTIVDDCSKCNLELKIEYKEIIKEPYNDTFNWIFYNDLLYNHIIDKSLLDKFKFQDNFYHFSIDYLPVNNDENNDENTDTVIYKSITDIKQKNIINTHTRFLQRYMFEKLIPPYLTEWIITEMINSSESNGINENNGIINLHKKPHILKILLLLSNSVLLPKIIEIYNLTDEIKLNIVDIVFINYENIKNASYLLEKSILNVLIDLNYSNSSENTIIGFEDGLENSLKSGDASIYSGLLNSNIICKKHSNNYLILIIIDII